MKRLLAVSLTLSLVFFCLCINAPAAQATQGGYVGEGLEWTLDETGTLIISGTGAMDGAFTYPAPWNAFAESVKKVVIQSGVTTVRNIAFMDCCNLTEVIIADTVGVIGYGAFANCERLTDIVIPESVTEIGTDAFSGCSSLASIVIPSGVRKISDYLFLSCTSLTDVTIPKGVEEIGTSAFGYCESLKEITIPSGVKRIGAYAFRECFGLESIVIPDSVTALEDGVFTGCHSLKSAVIGDGAEIIGKAFFQDCWALRDVTIGSNVTLIGNEAFSGCSSLTGISLPRSVTGIGDFAFYLCGSLSEIQIPAGVKKVGQYLFGECSSLKNVVIPDSVTLIDEWAFSNCQSLKSITLPQSVTTIARGAFNNCYSLEQIQIPAGVREIAPNTFSGCSSLEEITVPDGVTGIGDYAFVMCYDLTKIHIPDSVTAIGEGAFYYCRKLQHVTIPAGVPELGENTFADCERLPAITIPASVRKILPGAFKNCEGLREIRFMGNAPDVAPDAFAGVTATAYYPEDNATWTEQARQNYGGNISWVAVEVEKPSVEWVSASTTLGGNIGLNFYVKLADQLVNDESTFVRFTFADRTIDVPFADALVSVKDGVTRYRFTCSLNARNMTDEVTAQVMTSAGAVGDPLKMSIAKYCNYMIQYGGNQELADLMKAMLNYGAAAQVLFDYNTDKLANAELSEEDKVLAEVDASAYASVITGSEEGIKISSATLMLQTETSVRIYFMLTGDKTIEDYTFYVDGKEVTPIEKDGKYYVAITDIKAQDLDKTYTITVGGLTIQYSGLSYINTVINNPATAGEALVNVAKAIFAYNKRAEEYFN